MSDPLSLPAHIYSDLKQLAKSLVSSLIDPARRKLETRAIIQRFSGDFLRLPASESHLIDYYKWIDDDEDWRIGNGLLTSATYGELIQLWTNPQMFVIFEAKLRRFINRGGKVRRVFLLGPDLADAHRRLLLVCTLWRHEFLGFAPRVSSVLDLRKELRRLGVDCAMFTGLNGRVLYMFQFPELAAPHVLRTTNQSTVTKAENCFLRLWNSAERFDRWYPKQPLAYEASDQLVAEIEEDRAAVENVAASR